MRLAYVQAENGVPSAEPFFKAWVGLRRRGMHCELFEPARLHAGGVVLGRDTLVVGGVPVVEAALRQLGVAVPEADTLPAPLRPYLGRKVWAATLGELRARFAGSSDPIFVKPRRRHKAFPAVAVYGPDDLPSGDDAREVWVAEYVVFRSEWRAFVLRGEVLDLCRYQGDPLCYPDARAVRGMVADFEAGPAAYGLDVGVLADGRTVLVEVNDAYALNPYGLDAGDYAEMLLARWGQMTA